MTSDCVFKRLCEEEYELQHFGFTSSEFLEQFSSTINETVESVHKDVEECIAVKLNLDDAAKSKLHEEMHTFSKLYFRKSKELLKKFESNVRSFFAIPENVTLETDSIHETCVTKDTANLLEEISNLEQQFLKEKTLLALYKEELDEIKQFEEYQVTLERLLKQIRKLPENQNSDLEKLFKKFERIYGRLQPTMNCEKLNAQCNAFSHRHKFVKGDQLEPLNKPEHGTH